MNTVADTRTLTERSEEELSWAGLAVAETIRAAELALIVMIALLVTPPLLILAVIVLVPAIAFAAVAAVIALPVFAIRHLHLHRASHAHARVHRLAQWGREDATVATSRLRRLGSRAQAKLYVKH
jgi:hypothetical protein